MSDSQPSRTKPARLERYVLTLAISWTIVMAGLLVWNVRQAGEIAQDIARSKAQLTLDVTALLVREQQTMAVELLSLGLLWVMGLAGIGLGARSLLHHAHERDRAEEELSEHRAHLEEMVQERTSELTHVNEQLQVEIAERKRAEEEQRALRQALGERVKELDCLYSITALIEKANTLEEVLEGVADLMPSGWQYPEIACARIVLRGQEFKSENYQETAWRQSGDIVAQGERVGTLDVCYLEERPAGDEGPFLKEERKLLAAIAERLGRTAERMWAEAALRASEQRFRSIIEQSRDGITVTDEQGLVIEWNQAMEQITGIKADEAAGRAIWDVQFQLGLEERRTPEMYRQIKAMVVELLGSGRAPWVGQSVDVEYRRPDGARQFVQSVVFPIKADQGFMLGSITRDITERKEVEEALAERMRFETLLSDLSATLINLPAGEVDRAIQQGLQRIVELLDVDRGDLFEFSESKTEPYAIHSYTRPGLPPAPRLVTSEEFPWHIERLRRGEILAVERLDDLPAEAARDKESALKRGFKSHLAIPLTIGGVNLGVISLGSSRHERAWPRDLIPRLKLIGEIFANAYARQQAEAALRESEARYRELLGQTQAALAKTEALYRVSRSLTGLEDLSGLLQAVVDSVADALPADRVMLITFDLEQHQVTHFVKGGPGADAVVTVSFDELWHGLSGWVMRELKPALSPKASPDPREGPEVQRRRAETNCGAVIVVPLRYQDKTLGTIVAINRPDEQDFTQQDVELMMAIASQAAIAFESARLFEQTQQDAQTKAELLREVNHRVKNNLVAILGLLLAEERYAPAEGRSFVEAAIDSLSHRIEGLLEVHQMLSESEWAPMRLSDLATRVVHAALSAVPPGRHVMVDVSSSPVEVSPRQANNLALVINELATNTVKYALAGRETARIAIRTAAEGDMIRLEYRDDGPGYPEETLRLECHNVGMYLLQTLVTQTLRGTLTLANDGGAVAILHVKTEEKERT